MRHVECTARDRRKDSGSLFLPLHQLHHERNVPYIVSPHAALKLQNAKFFSTDMSVGEGQCSRNGCQSKTILFCCLET